MTFFQAMVMGIVEGLTEFLPISSTFHMIVAAKFLGIPQTEFTKFFEVFVQAGAILPLVAVFAKELLQDRRLLLKTIVGFLPAAVIGLLLHKLIKEVFFAADWLMVTMFIVFGLVFVIVEWLAARKKLECEATLDEVNLATTMKAGMFQAIAVIPGVSRSGATMVGSMYLGMNRAAATKFSFLLAIPTILAASGLDLFQSREMVLNLSTPEWQALTVGFTMAMVVGWLSIHWLLAFVRNHSLAWFGWYRVVAGLVLAGYLVLS